VQIVNKEQLLNEIEYTNTLPGGISFLCAIQSEFYARHWGFNHLYESVVASSVGEFLNRYDKHKDYIEFVIDKGHVAGGIAIDHHDGKVAQLRWFIVAEKLHGLNIGKKLMRNAMQFVEKQNFKQVFLTTFEGLDSARYLYEKHGFSLTAQKQANTWGKTVNEQRFDWINPNYK
jgi:GNAT superfamily N-acetyltransferase